jgi:hypothetical protein
MDPNQHPAFSPEREAFRQRFNLRLLASAEEGHHIGLLPDGVYGFTSSAATSELPLFRLPTFRSFEIHKLAGGEVCYVGYVTEAEYQQFQRGSEPGVLTLHPEPSGAATHLISLPLARMDRVKPPAREEGNSIRVEFAPRAEFLGLSGALN